VSAQPDDAETTTYSNHQHTQTVASRSDADADQDKPITTQALQERERGVEQYPASEAQMM
jgi:hypothetical protein